MQKSDKKCKSLVRKRRTNENERKRTAEKSELKTTPFYIQFHFLCIKFSFFIFHIPQHTGSDFFSFRLWKRVVLSLTFSLKMLCDKTEYVRNPFPLRSVFSLACIHARDPTKSEGKTSFFRLLLCTILFSLGLFFLISFCCAA